MSSTTTSTSDLTTLNDQIQLLNDRQAIADLITRLGLMLDEKRYDEAPAIFAEDVLVHTPGGTARGPEAAVAHAHRNHTVRTQHAISGLLVELDGDRAVARANLIATFVPDSDQPDERLVVGNSEQPESRLMLGERYRFEAARGKDGWRLTTIEAQRLWSSQAIPTGALVTQTNRSASAAVS